MMSSDQVITLCRETLYTAMILACPILVVGLVVGLSAAVLQAITSIQEQTLSMIPKMIAVGVTLMILAPWIIRRLMAFADANLTRIAG